jgi:serine/threonine-protein kinase RsbW
MSDDWIWRCDRVIPSDTRACRAFLDEVLGQLDSRHWAQPDVFAVHLALEEALVNAILHGNRLDSAKQVHVACQLSPHRLRVEIADEGPGFKPESLPDPTCAERLDAPCGRGVMLMRAFMSRVEYNATGNRVVLEKERGVDGA